MRTRTRFPAIVAALALLAACGASAAPAPRLEYRGRTLTARQVQSLFNSGPGGASDSAALARGLDDLMARLQDLGHLDARARARWDSAAGPRLVVEVDEGPRYRLGAISLVTPASGDSARFVQVYNEYRKAKDVTEARLYFETMERVLRGRPKYLIDSDRSLVNVLPTTDAVRRAIPFHPNVRDGRSAAGLRVPKSNWANPLDTPPFQAYAVTCGVTFTFGGVSISTKGAVQSVVGADIPGLYAAGEMVGGLFYFNYPSGTGLVSGAVFGKIAGSEAGAYAVRRGIA